MYNCFLMFHVLRLLILLFWIVWRIRHTLPTTHTFILNGLTQTAHLTDNASKYTFIPLFVLHELCTHQRIIAKLLLCTYKLRFSSSLKCQTAPREREGNCHITHLQSTTLPLGVICPANYLKAFRASNIHQGSSRRRQEKAKQFSALVTTVSSAPRFMAYSSQRTAKLGQLSCQLGQFFFQKNRSYSVLYFRVYG